VLAKKELHINECRNLRYIICAALVQLEGMGGAYCTANEKVSLKPE
jgi:hypothetical protein